MTYRHRLLSLIVLMLMIWVGCSDENNPTGSTPPAMAGVWIYDSVVSGGTVSMVPTDDTVTYRSDYTGAYRSSVGWGSYEFEFSVIGDSIFRTRTAGQAAGVSDTLLFEIDNNVFSYHRPGNAEVYYMSKL